MTVLSGNGAMGLFDLHGELREEGGGVAPIDAAWPSASSAA